MMNKICLYWIFFGNAQILFTWILACSSLELLLTKKPEQNAGDILTRPGLLAVSHIDPDNLHWVFYYMYSNSYDLTGLSATDDKLEKPSVFMSIMQRLLVAKLWEKFLKCNWSGSLCQRPFKRAAHQTRKVRVAGERERYELEVCEDSKLFISESTLLMASKWFTVIQTVTKCLIVLSTVLTHMCNTVSSVGVNSLLM